ncbi:MAG: nucleotidyltransferase [Deltaproteobacteria bacterium]|nr:nucleotidyltransferase [Deltaproteobacteria bacterium]
MKKIFRSLNLLHHCLTANHIDYAIIGGIAVAVWGEPRLTRDIDVKVLLSRDEAQMLLNAIKTDYEPFWDNPLEMLKKNGILFVHDTYGVRIDLHLSDTMFDRKVIERAIEIEIEAGIRVKLCTAEDLIIYKMLSTRGSDAQDFEGIIDHLGEALDDKYVMDWLKQFETALDDSTLINTYKRMRASK